MRDKHQDIKGSQELLFVLVALLLLREKKNKFHTRIDPNDFTMVEESPGDGFYTGSVGRCRRLYSESEPGNYRRSI